MAGKSDYSKIHKRFVDQKKRMAEMDDDRWWKPEVPQASGAQITHRVRFMPPPDGFDSWYVEYGVHYRLKGDGDSTVTATCPLRTLGKPCPVCEFTKGLWKSGAESDQKIAREIGAKTRYASNVIVLSSNEPTKVRLWSYGTKVWTPLNELCVGDNGSFVPIDDPDQGFNIKVVVGMERTPEGSFPNYTIMPELKATALSDKNVLKNIHPVHELIRGKVKSYDELRSILLGAGAAAEADQAPPAKEVVEEASAGVQQEEEVVETVEEKTNAQTSEKSVSQPARPSTEDLVRKAREAMAKAKSGAK